MNQLQTLINLKSHLNDTVQQMSEKNDYEMNVTIDVNGQSFTLELNADVFAVLDDCIADMINDENEVNGQ